MKHQRQVELLQQCLDYIDTKTTQHEEQEYLSPVYKYHDQEYFDQELDAVFKRMPNMVAHVSEIELGNGFITRNLHGISVIIARQNDGCDDSSFKAMINVCKHRGARLEGAESGCKNRFVCPYHGWMFNNKGELKGVPHQEGFPTLIKSDSGLNELSLWVRNGFIFVLPNTDVEFDFDKFWAPIAEDLDDYNIEDMMVYRPVTKTWNSNWKIVSGGGLESYHFQVTHAKTIAPYFFSNTSYLEDFGPHFRLILPRQSINQLREQDQSEWQIRDHTHMVYQLFPNVALLVQEDHIAMFIMKPVSPSEVEITFQMLIPKDGFAQREQAYWDRNHQITEITLNEDFEMGESIQSGIRSGANKHLRFGLSEWGLAKLEQFIDQAIAGKPPGQ
ncbi:aromatic ring-hydroxylating dioxygenase subunit alpha [uncultured Pseudoteredinibacter sp.]|uniref:aromatic ring-hydroxylating oxygenase subunit alpha n=1 Tax=uncultured Pseudoteredinibacter sp. TaxID=1641701 RepID=UPI00261FBCDA|nr:aromatic ring-hydroxylating dioxygenase subunit alpha [uncultured Pseudoteredinibacter sp.]